MNSSKKIGIAACFAILLVFSLSIAFAGSGTTNAIKSINTMDHSTEPVLEDVMQDPMMYSSDGSSTSTTDAPTPETPPSPESSNSTGNDTFRSGQPISEEPIVFGPK